MIYTVCILYGKITESPRTKVHARCINKLHINNIQIIEVHYMNVIDKKIVA